MTDGGGVITPRSHLTLVLMLIEYPVSGVPDLGSAISHAQRQAVAAGYTHTSVQSTKQTSRNAWVITLFVSNSAATTQRR